MTKWTHFIVFTLFCLLAGGTEGGTILFIAGEPSHGAGKHDYPQGCELLADCLNQTGLGLSAEVSYGWPEDLAPGKYASIVVYSDGLDAHVAKGHAAELAAAVDAGAGLTVLHFATEPHAGAPLAGFLDAYLGGRFDKDLSVNPVWTLEKPLLTKHEITNGVELGPIEDEWYFHLKFADGIQPVLQANPSADVLGEDGPRSGNPSVRQALANNIPQTLGWTYESSPGKRAFGFTGGHYHFNWSNPAYRKLVLNGVIWTTGMNVPANGVETKVAAQPRYPTIDEAIARGDIEDVKRHLEVDSSRVEKANHPKLTPLHQAIMRKRAQIAILLIDKGAGLDTPDTSLRTPLHLAVERDLPEVIDALLKAGANPHLRDKAGWTPLHHAGAKNRLEAAAGLIQGGADPNFRSERGGTALHEAAASGGKELIKLLLDSGVDASVVSKNGDTALSVAKQSNNAEAVQILESL